MGTVVHFMDAVGRPEKLRKRFELATADWIVSSTPGLRPLLPLLVFESFFSVPAEVTLRLAENALRDYTLPWFTFCWEQQQLFWNPPVLPRI